MKGCLILQRYFAIIGNALAAELKELGVNELCAFIFLRRAEEYVKNQKEVKYTSLLVEEDLHKKLESEKLDLGYLKYLEENYGIPTLWEYITPDRTFMMQIPPKQYSENPAPLYSHEELLKCLQIRFREIISWLEKEKPDFLLCTPVGSMSGLILYHAAKKMGIPTLTIEFSRIKDFITLSRDNKTLTFAVELFKKIRSGAYKSPRFGEAEKLLKEMRQRGKVEYQPQLKNFDARKELRWLLPKNFLRAVLFLIKSTFDYLRSPYKNDYTAETPWTFLKNKAVRLARTLYGYSDFYERPDWNENFCYYQLHLEPEIAISVLAPFQSDQTVLIRQIARSLPAGFKLYVREHRDMVGFRPRSFYQKIKNIPNVRIISPEIDLFELMEKAKLVTAITSTAGFEAALLGKPVITFGDVFYNVLSSVKRCCAIEDLPQLIKNQLEKTEDNRGELTNFVAALIEESVEFNLFSNWFIDGPRPENLRDNPGIKQLARLILQKLSG